MKTPPAIQKNKVNPQSGYGLIPRDAIRAMCQKGMTDQARRLLLYYACQADGFRPSASTIHEATGLSQPHMIQARKKLEEAGLIIFDREANLIRITWGKDDSRNPSV